MSDRESFSFQQDTDYIIMQKMDIPTLLKFCRINKYTRKICQNETFWMQRFNSDFSNSNFKNSNRTWKDYYLKIIYYKDLSKNDYNKTSEYAAYDGHKDVVDFFISQDKFIKGIDLTPFRFGVPIFLREPLLNFIQNANLGSINGANKIQEILKPVLQFGLLDRANLSVIFRIYVYVNNLDITVDNVAYFKVGTDMNKYLNDYLNILEKEDNFDRNKLKMIRLVSIIEKGILSKNELNEFQREYSNNIGISKKLNEIYYTLSNFLKKIELL